jgi:hypothetical protein
MSRYILHYSPAGGAPVRDVRLMRSDPHTAIVAALDNAMLVEAEQASIDRFLAERPGWTVTPGSDVEFPVETGPSRARRTR